MHPADKTSFTALSNHVLHLVAQEKYKEALPVCERILELPQFSLRARLLQARCLLKLNKNREYADCIREAKATFPGCSDHIQEFERSIHSPQDPQNNINFGALFKTFKGWEEIDRQLNDRKSAPRFDKPEKTTKSELGAGDIQTDTADNETSKKYSL